MTVYTIDTHLGPLTIKVDRNGLLSCSLTTLESKNKIWRSSKSELRQLPLPYPDVLDASNYLSAVHENIDKILDMVSAFFVRRDSLIKLCIEGGDPAIDLLQSNPALALLLAVETYYHAGYSDNSRAARLVGMKRHEVLAYCSYPAQKWIARLLAKIPVSSCSPYLIADLRKKFCKMIAARSKSCVTSI